MEGPGELWRRLLFLFRRRQFDRDLEEEMRFHLEMRAEGHRRGGMDSGLARSAAQRQFGNSTLIRERSHEMLGVMLLDELGRNLRHAARGLRRSPSLAAIAVASLALGIGANTAVFSFVRAIVLNRLPVAAAERLVILRQRNEKFNMENCCFVYPFFRELRKQQAGFEDVLAVRTAEINFSDAGQTERITGELVSGNYFRMLGVRPAAGRLLDENDDAAEGAGRVCVISDRLWKERYGGRADVIGRRVLISQEPFTVVGVSEPGFTGASLHSPFDVQVPASMSRVILGEARDSIGWAELIARLGPGVSREQAEARLNAIGLQLEKAVGFTMGERDRFLLRDGSQGIGSRKEQLGRPVLLLQLLVGIVMLVACGNLALLLLMRSVERTREAGLRLALGAGRQALVRQFLTESLLLAAIGGAAGWVVARLLTGALLNLLGPQGAGLVRQVQPDATTIAFSFALTFATGILFGALPAWRAAHAEPLPAIRGVAAGTGRRFTASSLLVAGQIAGSLALLLGAGLLVQTLRNLRGIDLGLQPQNVALLRIDLSQTTHAGKAAGPFFEELLRRARALPQTRSASLTTMRVLTGAMGAVVIQVPGYAPPSRMGPVTYVIFVSGGYFRTLGIPLLAGRDFADTDRGGDGAVIVNERFAREFFGGDALGKAFSYGGGRKVRIVGIVASARFRYLREEMKPVMYAPVGQPSFPEAAYLQVRTTGAPMLDRLRSLVKEMDSRVPIESISTMELEIDRALARERLLTFLSTLLGGFSIALAALGLYGLLSFRIARRTHEIGIRMALGAQRGSVLRMVARETAVLIGAGIAVGIPAALAVGGLMQSLLYGLKPHDPTMLALAVAVLATVAAAACHVPARRATHIDPMEALRHE